MADDPELELEETLEDEVDPTVDDEAASEDEAGPQFTITSYGADYTVDSIVKRVKQSAFIIPDFQRRYVWTLRHASQFIESLLMGLPVPGIFLYKQPETNTHLVIDGQQRLKTLHAFYDGEFRGKPFKLVNVRKPWVGKSYNELDQADQLKLDDSIVHATIFQQEKPEDVLSSIHFVFQRINTGGMSLASQEIRNAVSAGVLLTRIAALNVNAAWRKIFGKESPRLKDQELILRFFALMSGADKYARPMTDFLNEFADDHKDGPQQLIDDLSNTFERAIELLYAAEGQKCFRLVRTLNAAVFDSVMVGMGRRLAAPSAPDIRNVKAAYEKLLADQTFRSICEKATADEESVAKRLALATEAFANT
jgi:hypothetical protein